MDKNTKAMQAHYDWQGKIEVVARAKAGTAEELAVAYTPGVAEPCLAIQENQEESFALTRRWNLVGVITDGTAVLGLGNIGPEAGMPVMEGKCVLFKEFGDVDAFPLCVRANSTEELIQTIANIAPSFGGINLEDIAAPACFEVERRLKEICDIPVFHDDQHGTAIVTGAALLNALRLVKKDIRDVECVISGAGAAGISIAEHLMRMGMQHVTLCNSRGIVCEGDPKLNPAAAEIATRTNRSKKTGSLADALRGADVFVGVSAPGLVTEEMVASMAKDPIVMAMANPVPEIMPDKALAAGAAVVGTGRSDFPNQINNVLAFPGIFRGALDVRASDINDEMQMAASYAIASLVSDEELTAEYILPAAFDKRVGKTVAAAVAEAARKTGVARK